MCMYHPKYEVEIDESLFSKKCKNNRGEVYKKQWVFDITERSHNNVFMLRVRDERKIL